MAGLYANQVPQPCCDKDEPSGSFSLDPWQHRAASMRCRTCMYWVEKAIPYEPVRTDPLGRCRRHAPTMSGFPAAYASDWCGDHKLDEHKA